MVSSPGIANRVPRGWRLISIFYKLLTLDNYEAIYSIDNKFTKTIVQMTLIFTGSIIVCDAIVTGTFAILGTIIGIITTWLINYTREKRDRKDRFYFSMLEKRFAVNQQAFANVEELKKVIHKEDSDSAKIEIIEAIKKWFNANNLYLEPDIRNQFKDVIFNTGIYGSLIEEWRFSGNQNGWGAEETEAKAKEMRVAFEMIMKGIQNAIQKSMDNYYQQLK